MNIADVVSAACLLAGCTLSLIAAIGLVRFPDLFSRMHAGTKPQVLGLLLVLVGVGLRLRDWTDIGMLLAVAMFQLLTAPVAAHMIGRAAYQGGAVRQDTLLVDELTSALEADDPGQSGRT
ncbi:monovalent cation/H(+) antiporter subunit G [Jiangella ureilytica]|uniref:Monovalent cation/H(+) antiporter subunit G n=1 Tax=Jiangella ureilytica TaxID=2530374 RepID=A0A4R4RD92_9ACTN|nr:monovalent cation/H(+) antiporter subunit G [Jiangella ureilytica]TDC47140.1 monovalent cation/H(+) antiporter subunit G [Jiangella ureilytica]